MLDSHYVSFMCFGLIHPYSSITCLMQHHPIKQNPKCGISKKKLLLCKSLLGKFMVMTIFMPFLKRYVPQKQMTHSFSFSLLHNYGKSSSFDSFYVCVFCICILLIIVAIYKNHISIKMLSQPLYGACATPKTLTRKNT